MSDEVARRLWVIPPAAGVMGGLDLSYLDPADGDDRHFLLLAEHPELWGAIESDLDEIVLHGASMSPRLHITLHEVVANQLWQDDPPEMWTTAQRLTAAGHDRHDVLHMLGTVVSAAMYNAMVNQEPFDIVDTRRRLARLPGSWEDLASAPAEYRATRYNRERRSRR
jgi:hypothetical protein